MSRQTSRHRNFWTPILFFLLLIIGVFIGFQLNKYIGAKRPITTVIERNDRLEELINLINDRYVDTVNTDSLYQDAITGILGHLDPHTVYIPAFEAAAMTAGLKGEFKGIGIEALNIQDTFRISRIWPNSPADEAGLQLGDGLIAIDSSPVVSRSLNIDDLKKMFAAKDRSSMTLVIARPGDTAIKYLTVKKGIVPIYSISAQYMINDHTGYIRIARFSAITYREFKKALGKLQHSGMKQLILDLRGNPGGYVDAATAIADEFLNNHRLIVYTKGRRTPREDFYADQNGIFEKGRLAVLIDAGTASAAEILTGAIQDWDRGIVLGTRSFGKGLVQQQYELGDGSLLRLTIARYYTPSGRCIQRPYNNGKLAYEQAYLKRLYHPEDIKAPDTSDVVHKQYYSLVFHRILYGGGGIMPDINMAQNPAFSEEDMLKITSERWIDDIIFNYYLRHFKKLNELKSANALSRQAQVPDYVLDQLKLKADMSYPEAAYILWQNPLALDYLRRQMKASLIRLMLGGNAYFQFINQNDEVMKKAVKTLDSPEYLTIIEGKAA
ncbi:MAG TPA: S41 family peptidase [Edaphocola sp.]|nr:S41 family peptidase [Edaphocola sp.]